MLSNQDAISALTAVKNTLQGQIAQLQGQMDAMDAAITVLTNGYAQDQAAVAAQAAITTFVQAQTANMAQVAQVATPALAQ